MLPSQGKSTDRQCLWKERRELFLFERSEERFYQAAFEMVEL